MKAFLLKLLFLALCKMTFAGAAAAAATEVAAATMPIDPTKKGCPPGQYQPHRCLIPGIEDVFLLCGSITENNVNETAGETQNSLART